MAGRFSVVSVLAVDDDAADDDIVTGLEELIEASSPSTILIAGSLSGGVMRQVGDLALVNGCEVLAMLPAGFAAERPVLVWTGETPLIQLASVRRRTWQLSAKRAIDVIGALIGLVIAAPVLLVLSALICVNSPGSPIFRHERIGLRGKRFGCLKLRTMRRDAEKLLRADAVMYDEYRRNHFKIPDDRDPRTTRLGRFLRRSSLDELPQLWNVLRGEMSLVGPRPIVEEELGVYNGSRDLLLSMRPGITGAWAVGGRHCVGYPERCDLELRYVREWKLWLDVKILWGTAGAVVGNGKSSALEQRFA